MAMNWMPWWSRRGTEKPDRPIFILGSRRSGTSILGRTIGHHRQVFYLHEPRQIWKAAFPQCDIHTQSSIGRIVMNEKDWTRDGADRLAAEFCTILREQKKLRLCEKTPINSFRGPLLNRVFPDALYVFIEREPLAVAQSVAATGRYSGKDNANNSKWSRIEALAGQLPETRELAGCCETVLQKMLLEWILCSIFARRFLFEGVVPRQRVLHVKYEDFSVDSAAFMTNFEKFAGLDHDAAARDVATGAVHSARQAGPHHSDAVTQMLLDVAASQSETA